MFIKTEFVQCFTFGKEYSYHTVTAGFVLILTYFLGKVGGTIQMFNIQTGLTHHWVGGCSSGGGEDCCSHGLSAPASESSPLFAPLILAPEL